MRCVAGSTVLIALLFCPATHTAQSKRPELPFFDWNACPFEGCQYGQWTARKPVVVYDTCKRTRRPVARLAVGDKVLAVTGVVITYKPGIIRMDRDLPQDGLKRGDTILTYAYRGEGTSAAWVNGRYDPNFDISFTKWPDGGGCNGGYCAATYVDLGNKEWWAKVRLKSGETAWVNMDTATTDFDGVDALG